MRHKKVHRKLNVDSAHRRAMLRNLATNLLLHEQIKTTLPKAKELRPFVEKLITKAKADNLHNRRQLAAVLFRKDVLAKAFEDIGPRFLDRPGGYIRIIKAGFRYGDSAPVAYIELVDRDERAKGADQYLAPGKYSRYGAKEDEPDDLR